MNRTYSTTIHLTPDDVEKIIRDHFGLPGKGVSPGEIVSFNIAKQAVGYGTNEMDVHRFSGIDVTTTSQSAIRRLI